METFMTFDFGIRHIAVACYVPPSDNGVVYEDRYAHGLAFFLDGKHTYRFTDGTEITVGKSDVIYLPKHSCYENIVVEAGACYAINFQLDEDEDFPPFGFHIRDGREMTELFKNAQKAFEVKNPGYLMKCKALLCNIIYKMQKEYSLSYLPATQTEKIRPQLDYIHRNYMHGKISLPQLAAEAGMSEVYFRKLFQNVTGVTPVTYMNDLRIARAKELLASGLYSVHEVAAQSGFFDDSYFNRLFKKYTGISPKNYKG